MRIHSSAGPFAGDKDAAAHIRETYVKVSLAKSQDVVLDFAEVEFATQSFVHALIASVVRSDPDALDHIEFKNCNSAVKQVVEIVVDYAQAEFD